MFMNNAAPPTGEVGLPERPTKRPGYTQIPPARQRSPRGARVARYLTPTAPPAFVTAQEAPFKKGFLHIIEIGRRPWLLREINHSSVFSN